MRAANRLDHARILMYSHDTFGLGHLRRCRAIAHALVERFKGLFVLIISGSPIAGTFDFRARVDFVKVPSVIKLYNGEYTSIDQLIDLHDTLAIRRAIIRHTAESFNPDLVIVDKEPLGLKGEMEETLGILKGRGAALMLGLRDVMDAPELLAREWAPRNTLGKIGDLYNDVVVYGPESFWDPLTGLDAPPSVRSKRTFAGFLRRTLPSAPYSRPLPFTNPYILVTAGGGGDGAQLMEWTINAYQHDPGLPHPALLVLGPFMPSHEREDIRRRAESLDNVTVIDFDNRMEMLMAGAIAVVAMGGYNTFCEILSFDKRAIIVPRVEPRKEQLIRAQRGAELGLVSMLMPDDASSPATFAKALHQLPMQQLPSRSGPGDLLGGLDAIGDIVAARLAPVRRPKFRVVEAGS